MNNGRTDNLKLIINNEEDIEMELKPITGGKTPNGIDWLSELELGTMFLIQDRTTADFNLGHFCLVGKTEKACVLKTTKIDEPLFVNPIRFCQKYSMFENLGTLKDEHIRREEAIEQEQSDGENSKDRDGV